MTTTDDETSILDDLLAACTTTPIDERRAIGRTGHGGEHRRTGIFGGQMISQSLAACAHTVPEGSVPESLHVNLLSGGTAGEPIEFHVDRVRDGRNLQHREVRGHQDGRVVVQATVVAARLTDGLDWQRSPAPAVGPPHTGDDAPTPWGRGLGWGVFDMAQPRTDAADPPPHPLWVRSPVPVPDDPWLTAAVYAFWSDFGPNWSIRVSHREITGDEDEVFSLSATHSVWFHRTSPVDEWHLFDAQTHSIAHHQGLVHATLHDGTGRLNASITQGIYIRA